jgi:hypothetical protein
LHVAQHGNPDWAVNGYFCVSASLADLGSGSVWSGGRWRDERATYPKINLPTPSVWMNADMRRGWIGLGENKSGAGEGAA